MLEYYWNIQTPPVFEPDRIWQYDLDLDVKCRANHDCVVVDRDEFEARRGLYPAEWISKAILAVDEVCTLVRGGGWPVRPPDAPQKTWLER